MRKGKLHKILLTLFLTVAVLTPVKAQNPYVALPGAIHKFSITEQIGNAYEWNVYVVSNWTDQKDAILADHDGLNADDDFLFAGGEYQKHEINITFLNEGKYYVIAEEFSSGTTCSSRKAFALEVLGTGATIEFKELASEDCADESSDFATELVAMFDSGSALPESHYPITVNYRFDGEAEDRTANLSFADKMLNISGITEDKNNETINNITIMSATTAYGRTLNIVPGKETHVRTIHALPNTIFGNYESVIQAETIQAYTATINKNENYDIFVPAGATVLNENTTQLSDNFHSELSFDVHWTIAPGDYQVKLTERSALNCTGDTVSASITVIEAETFSVNLDDLSFCSGETGILTPEIDFDGNYSYLWSDGSENPNLEVSEAGTYSVTVTDTNTGRQELAMVNVTVWDAPMVDLGDDIELASGQTVELDAGNAGSSYLWFVNADIAIKPSAIDQIIEVSQVGEYRVEVTNEYTCVGKDAVNVSSHKYDIYLPTAFSTSSRSIDNKEFKLFGDTDQIKEMSLTIVNRLGFEIFQTKQNIPWDGTFKGQKIETDVYVYFLRVTFKDGSQMQKQGNVTLLR